MFGLHKSYGHKPDMPDCFLWPCISEAMQLLEVFACITEISLKAEGLSINLASYVTTIAVISLSICTCTFIQCLTSGDLMEYGLYSNGLLIT